MITFLCIYCLMILLATGLCCGWFVITRGQEYITPDGKAKKYGMLFKGWSFFWEGYQLQKIYYSKEEALVKFDFLLKTRPDIAAKITYNKLGVLWPDQPLSEKEILGMEDVLACKVDKRMDGLHLFVEEPLYTFPEWIRKPMSECVICFSSVYGSAFYWFVVLQTNTLFSWANKENLAKFGFWVIFCLILACANKYISQKMKL
jgi:hypothetical protein